MKRVSIFAFLLFLSVSLAMAQGGIRIIEGSYLYHAPEDMTPSRAKEEALNRAKIEALADAFGTVVSQSSVSVMSNRGDAFYSEGATQVKGEWLETLGEPHFEMGFSELGMWVKCSVRGKAREISTAREDVVMRIYANGIEPFNESVFLRAGSHLYVSQQAPVAGYVAIFLYDIENDVVNCLFPYKGSASVPHKMPGNHVNYFFDPQSDVTDLNVRRITVNCEKPREINTIYLTFSKSEYPMPVLENHKDIKTMTPTLSYEQFNKWISKRQVTDPGFQVVKENITISKNFDN